MKADLANSLIMMCIMPNVVTGEMTVEDFCYWRGIRAANTSALLNKKEEKEEHNV